MIIGGGPASDLIKAGKDVQAFFTLATYVPGSLHQAQMQVQQSAMATVHMPGQHALRCSTMSSKDDSTYAK